MGPYPSTQWNACAQDSPGLRRDLKSPTAPAQENEACLPGSRPPLGTQAAGRRGHLLSEGLELSRTTSGPGALLSTSPGSNLDGGMAEGQAGEEGAGVFEDTGWLTLKLEAQGGQRRSRTGWGPGELCWVRSSGLSGRRWVRSTRSTVHVTHDHTGSSHRPGTCRVLMGRVEVELRDVRHQAVSTART